MRIKFWLKKVKPKDGLNDVAVDRRIILKYILDKYGVKNLTRYKWLITESTGELLQTRQ
jgi:hypothetical protein